MNVLYKYLYFMLTNFDSVDKILIADKILNIGSYICCEILSAEK